MARCIVVIVQIEGWGSSPRYRTARADAAGHLLPRPHPLLHPPLPLQVQDALQSRLDEALAQAFQKTGGEEDLD